VLRRDRKSLYTASWSKGRAEPLRNASNFVFETTKTVTAAFCVPAHLANKSATPALNCIAFLSLLPRLPFLLLRVSPPRTRPLLPRLLSPPSPTPIKDQPLYRSLLLIPFHPFLSGATTVRSQLLIASHKSTPSRSVSAPWAALITTMPRMQSLLHHALLEHPC
jgi:hypothetical protein